MQKQTEYSPIAQSVERVTVNHDVVGSSPTWGAKKKTDTQMSVCFFISFSVGLEQDGDYTAEILFFGCCRKKQCSTLFFSPRLLAQRVQLGEPRK